MSRLTQMIEYLNADKHPTKDDIKEKYYSFCPNEISKKVRKKYRNKIKNESNKQKWKQKI